MIRPLHNRILVKRVAEPDKTAGGSFIPDTAKQKPLEALVVSVGSGKVLEHLILSEDDVLAILEK